MCVIRLGVFSKTIDLVRLSPALAGLNDLVVEFLGLAPQALCRRPLRRLKTLYPQSLQHLPESGLIDHGHAQLVSLFQFRSRLGAGQNKIGLLTH